MNNMYNINYLNCIKLSSCKKINKELQKDNKTVQINEDSIQRYSKAYTSIGKSGLSFRGVVKITPEIIKIIKSEYASGKSLQQVALALSGLGITLSVGYIGKLIKKQEDKDEIVKQHIQNNPYASHKVSAEDITKIVEMYSNGFSTYQIADILGFYQSTIAFYIKSADNFEQIKQQHAKNNKTKKFISTPEFEKKVIDDYKQGKQVYKIAQEFCCVPSVIISCIARHSEKENIKQEHIENKQGIAIITEEKVQEMIKLYINGMYPDKIAKKIGCSKTSVNRCLKQQENYDELAEMYYKNKPAKKCKGMSVITADLIEKMIHLYSEGYPFKTIGQMLNCSYTTVAKYIKQNDNYEEIEKKHTKNNKSKLAIITDDKIFLMESLYKAGKTSKEIAVIVGCSGYTVDTYIKNLSDYEEIKKEHDKNYNGPLALLSDDEVAEVITLYSEGKTSQEIADIYGCSPATVMNKIKADENYESIMQKHIKNYSRKKE